MLGWTVQADREILIAGNCPPNDRAGVLINELARADLRNRHARRLRKLARA